MFDFFIVRRSDLNTLLKVVGIGDFKALLVAAKAKAEAADKQADQEVEEATKALEAAEKELEEAVEKARAIYRPKRSVANAAVSNGLDLKESAQKALALVRKFS